MANRIKLRKGLKSTAETNVASLLPNEIFYLTDTKEIGVKNESGGISYFTTQSGIVKGTVATAAATAAKTTTIANYTLKEGDLLAIKFTLGNTASNPTLNINGGGAIPIKLGGQNPTGTANTGAAYIAANGTMLLYYDGTNFNMAGSNDIADTTYSAMTQAEFDTGTATTGRTVSAKFLKDNINAMINEAIITTINGGF